MTKQRHRYSNAFKLEVLPWSEGNSMPVGRFRDSKAMFNAAVVSSLSGDFDIAKPITFRENRSSTTAK